MQVLNVQKSRDGYTVSLGAEDGSPRPTAHGQFMLELRKALGVGDSGRMLQVRWKLEVGS
jgi:hypothetical protein